MAHLPTDPADFASKAIDGFVQAHSHHVRRVDSGVVRLAPILEGQVGVVVGGGSAHYSAFAGQVYRVGTAVERGAGLLLAFGNYAGDVLHFNLGAERLRWHRNWAEPGPMAPAALGIPIQERCPSPTA